MKYLFIILIGLTFSNVSKAQFALVSDTSVVYLQLKRFYLEGVKDTSNYHMPLIYQTNILDSAENKFGIFIFRPLTSNALQQLYFRNFGYDTIEIIRQYNIEKLFNKIFDYFRNNTSMITYTQKLECARKVIEVLQQRIR